MARIVNNSSYYGNTDWRTKLKEIMDIDSEYSRFKATMTPTELQKLADRRKALKDSYQRLITDSASKELMAQVENVKRKRETLQKYKKAENNSWDSAKLSSEYAVMSVILDMALVAQNKMTGDTVSTRVEKLWKEARTSENKYKIKALADLLDGVAVKAEMEEARKVNLTKIEAQELINKLRETPEILKSKDEIQTAFEEFSQALREYRETGRVLGEETSYDWNIRELRIYEDEDGLPEVEIEKHI